MTGLEVKNLQVRSKKLAYLVNLKIPEHKLACLIFDKKPFYHNFIKKITGRKKISIGKVFLQEKEITTNLKKNKTIAVIRPFRLSFRVLPIKWILASKIFVNPNFYHKAYLIYQDSLSDYHYAKSAVNNNNLLELYKTLDFYIKAYLNNMNYLFVLAKDNFVKSNQVFYNKKIKAVKKWPNSRPNLANALTTYMQQQSRTFCLQQKVIILQALWDQLEEIKNSEPHCECYTMAFSQKKEYNFFSLEPLKLVLNKYQKKITANILHYRYLIHKEEQNLKEHLKKFSYYCNDKILLSEIRKLCKFQGNNFKYFFNWQKEWMAIMGNFQNNIHNLVNIIIKDEQIITKIIIFNSLHLYHIMLWNDEIVYNNMQLMKNTIKKKQQAIKPVFNQAFVFVKRVIEKLDMKINIWQITKNFTTFDAIKIQIIHSYLRRDKLIILDRVIDYLTNKQALELKNIILNYQKIEPDICFINTSNSLRVLKNYGDWFYILDARNISFSSAESFNYPMSLEIYNRLYEHFLDNIYQANYYKKDNIIKTEHTQIFLTRPLKAEEGDMVYLVFHPLNISFNRDATFNQTLNLNIQGRVIKVQKIHSKYLISFETNSGMVIHLEQALKMPWKLQTNIYFNYNSFLIYNKQKNLIYHE